MRVVVVGATGTIGREVVKALRPRHEIVEVARSTGSYRADIAHKESIISVLEAIGPFDALVSAAGEARFKPLEDLTDEDFGFSLASKLLGQVNLVRVGVGHARDRGSFTLTSGVLSAEPMPGSAAISLVNAAVEGFARAAALEATRGIRVNVVSPPWVSETLQAMGQDPSGGMPAEQVARAYVASVEGSENGAVIDARRYAG